MAVRVRPCLAHWGSLIFFPHVAYFSHVLSFFRHFSFLPLLSFLLFFPPEQVHTGDPAAEPPGAEAEQQLHLLHWEHNRLHPGQVVRAPVAEWVYTQENPTVRSSPTDSPIHRRFPAPPLHLRDYFKNVLPLKSSSVVHLLKLSSLCGASFFLSFFMDYLKLITAHVGR